MVRCFPALCVSLLGLWGCAPEAPAPESSDSVEFPPDVLARIVSQENMKIEPLDFVPFSGVRRDTRFTVARTGSGRPRVLHRASIFSGSNPSELSFDLAELEWRELSPDTVGSDGARYRVSFPGADLLVGYQHVVLVDPHPLAARADSLARMVAVLHRLSSGFSYIE